MVASAVAIGGLAVSAYSAKSQADAAKKANKIAASQADPGNYPNIKIPGFAYQDGTPTVDMPVYQPQTYGNSGAEIKMAGALDESHQALLAALNPNSEVLRGLSAEQEQLNNQDFLKGLSQTVRLNNRQRAQGRGSFLDTGSGDQDIMSKILNNARDSQLKARITARTNLNDTAQKLQGVASGYGAKAVLAQNRLGLERNDRIMSNQQQRENIFKALDYYRGNQGNLNTAQTNAVNTENKNTAAQIAEIKNLFNTGANAYSNYSGGSNSTPWVNPDHIQRGSYDSSLPWLNS
jgi:hypothetical protein